jgi:hypothetical protein
MYFVAKIINVVDPQKKHGLAFIHKEIYMMLLLVMVKVKIWKRSFINVDEVL